MEGVSWKNSISSSPPTAPAGEVTGVPMTTGGSNSGGVPPLTSLNTGTESSGRCGVPGCSKGGGDTVCGYSTTPTANTVAPPW